MGKSLSKVVWFDPKVFNNENKNYFEELKDGMDIQRFDNLDGAYQYIHNNQELNFIVISCGSKG
jgi:hypothetical protein